MSETGISEYLAQHPKMIGVLFTITLLLTQAGSVVANGGGMATPGP
ncbi:DUF7503 family protein [Halalkaliarchaeum desulfuricum]|nr:hypothetical protein [Halalkaliarchaeum desulfuricum]